MPKKTQPKPATNESNADINIENHPLKLTHLEKVFYPHTGFTKGDVLNYYIEIAPVLLPHIKNRPLTLKRYPNGVEGEFFYEKRAPKYKPSWLKTIAVNSRRDPSGTIDYCLVNDLASLVWVVNLADLELHTFLAQKKNVERPTQVVFDLDPGAPADVTDCAQVALWTKEWLEKVGLRCWVKSSGSKGLQLHVPLNTKTDYEATKSFAKAVAIALEKAYPDRVVSNMKKELRHGKVLVDWSQNDANKTTICVYSLRAKERPYVAAPVSWREVEECLKKDEKDLLCFDSGTVLKRIRKDGDLFQELLTVKQVLKREMIEAVGEFTSTEATTKRSKATAAPKPEGLRTYNKKRNFTKTNEPPGEVSSKGGGTFVIQKHQASHLHYDFRLAMGGVLKSWAVPRAIPYEKGEKHLAVEVEDHPMNYADFEGTIPVGQYGGGTVMVWDTGKYSMLGGTPLQAWEEGLLHLKLEGKKLKGEWTLIRTKQLEGNKRHWLLLKSGEGVPPLSAKADDRSALTGRTMAKIAKDNLRTWNSNAGEDRSEPSKTASRMQASSSARKTVVSRKLGPQDFWTYFVDPMKCLPRKRPPEGEGWLYEIKFDGYRALAICRDSRAQLFSRNKKSFTDKYPGVVEALSALPLESAILDGELVAFDDKKQQSFQALQNYNHDTEIAYFIFDLLELDGKSFTKLPLVDRKKRLGKLLESVQAPIFFSDNLPGTPDDIWSEIKKQRLEGLIAKRADSVYEPGLRSGQWVKVKAINQQEFVLGGFTPPSGSRTAFGALLLGVYEKGKLLYVGKVGTGFNSKSLRSIFERMQPHVTKVCPFVNLPQPRNSRWGGGLPQSEMRECTWLEPKLVCEVQFTEWTGDGALRHPSFQGLREDVSPEDVHRERPV